MALTAHNWTSVAGQMAAGSLPLISASIQHRVILFTTPTADPDTNVNTDSTIAAVKTTMGSANELATGLGGSNYTKNASFYLSGQALASVTWGQSTTYWGLSCANPAWTNASSLFNPAYAVFGYWPAGTPADSACLPTVWWNFNSGATVVGGGGTYTLAVSAFTGVGTGLLTFAGTG